MNPHSMRWQICNEDLLRGWMFKMSIYSTLYFSLECIVLLQSSGHIFSKNNTFANTYVIVILVMYKGNDSSSCPFTTQWLLSVSWTNMLVFRSMSHLSILGKCLFSTYGKFISIFKYVSQWNFTFQHYIVQASSVSFENFQTQI